MGYDYRPFSTDFYRIKQDGDIVEIPACRFFTDKFFKCFGLSSMLKKHKRGYFEFECQKNNREGQHQKKVNSQATRTVDQVQKESEEFDQVYKKPEAPPTPPDKVPEFLKKKSFYKGF
ncbi:MAG: hypothetical protein KZQ56_13620 [gamma proteobacterium symbiont of Lucinoma myriamae]|nr:hypothetical protein [gamma proteobacterium symbiont of Lucinoma myriamae]